jgi:hypothetical protein
MSVQSVDIDHVGPEASSILWRLYTSYDQRSSCDSTRRFLMEAARDHRVLPRRLTQTNAPGIYETGTFVVSQLDISHGLTFTPLPVSCAWREWLERLLRPACWGGVDKRYGRPYIVVRILVRENV